MAERSLMNLKELAAQLAGFKLIAEAAKTATDKLRNEFQQALQEVGADSARAEINGVEVGKVSLTAPKPSASVADEQAFTKWVQQRYEDEIVISVTDVFKKKLLAELTNADGVAVDKNGEVVDGIIFRQREPFVTTRFNPDGREITLNAIKDSKVMLAHIVELASQETTKEIEE